MSEVKLEYGYQAYLSRQSGVSRQTICFALAGMKGPNYDNSKLLATASGTDVTLWLEKNPVKIKEAILKSSAYRAFLDWKIKTGRELRCFP